MSAGVLFYNHGQGCLARLCVAATSLRKYYQGPVAIANEGRLPLWCEVVMKDLCVQIVQAPISNEYGLIKKSRVWKVSPYKHTMYLDSDVLVRGSVDQFFKWIRKFGLVATHFNGWHTHRGRMRRRIEQWREKFPKETEAAVKYGGAINTGIMGWTKGAPQLAEYTRLTEEGMSIPGIHRKTLDELALQLVVPGTKHKLAPPEWNTGVMHGDGSKAVIVHYHGHKHCRDNDNGELWKAQWREFAAAYPEAAKEAVKLDSSIALWLSGGSTTSGSDMTIVTAINPPYLEKAKRNIPLWMANPGLKNHKFIVFVNGFKRPGERAFLDAYPNVQVIRWKYPHEGASPRETMLSAFVLGTAQYVRTKYWMKLDCDTAPTKEFVWPEYKKHTIVSHKWGYTKMKADPTADEHWFNKLDRIFSPKKPVFSRKLCPVADHRLDHGKGNPDGIGHRFASFAHIERTEFTKRLAKVVREKCGGRLPIPSHDTLAWYAATLWEDPFQLINMKEWFNPHPR